MFVYVCLSLCSLEHPVISYHTRKEDIEIY